MSIALPGALLRPFAAASATPSAAAGAPPWTERIAVRLSAGYGAIIALMLVVLAVTLLQLQSVRGATENILGPQAERVALAREWRQNIAVNAARTLAIGLSQDESLGRLLGPDMAATTKRTGEIQQRMIALLTSEAGRAGMQRMAQLRERYLAAREALFKARGDNAALAQASEGFRQAGIDYAAEADQMVAAMLRHNADAGQGVYDALDKTRLVFIALLGAAVALAVCMAARLARGVVGPLAAASEAARRIADGDLSYELRVSGKGEVAQLMQALVTMEHALRALVLEVREGGESIGSACAQVAVGNADLSRRTEVTASDLQVTAHAMGELAGTLRQTADVSGQANALVSAASEVAQRGGSVVAQVVSTMDQISQSSHRIADIIGVIDGIAFQTNILALNAAVEAARAGEQGRGFAVVAAEVRNLAQRSAEAAREIKTLIGTSVERTEAGARLVGQAGQTMDEVVASVSRVSGLIGEISAAASQQRDGIEQINAAVQRLDEATRENAALVEESAAAADSLQRQAQRLNAAVGTYRV